MTQQALQKDEISRALAKIKTDALAVVCASIGGVGIFVMTPLPGQAQTLTVTKEDRAVQIVAPAGPVTQTFGPYAKATVVQATQYDEPGTVWHGTFARFAEWPEPDAGAVVQPW